ncbi:hypothetical protein GCM10027168_74740 [Streptomyces capparidis]
MTGNLKLRSMAVVAACPDRVLASRAVMSDGTGLSGFGAAGFAGLRPSGAVMAGSAVRERAERPIQAPEAVAQAHAYVAAKGAGVEAKWLGDSSFTEGDAVFTTRTQQTTRAFRGLQPWRDPA